MMADADKGLVICDEALEETFRNNKGIVMDLTKQADLDDCENKIRGADSSAPISDDADFERKVGIISHGKNIAAIMQAIRGGDRLGQSVNMQSIDIMDAMYRPHAAQGDPVITKYPKDVQVDNKTVEHILSAKSSRHYLTTSAGFGFLDRSQHTFKWVEFYGSDERFEIEKIDVGYPWLRFHLSAGQMVNVGRIDRGCTVVYLQNAKIKAIGVQSRRI